MIHLLENIDRVDLQLACTAEGYGEFQIDHAQDEYAKEMDLLENSENPLKNSFVDYMSDLERCVDIKSYVKLIA